jgi:hypothetical protein
LEEPGDISAILAPLASTPQPLRLRDEGDPAAARRLPGRYSLAPGGVGFDDAVLPFRAVVGLGQPCPRQERASDERRCFT